MEYIDISDEQITKRQHYVPKVYLKKFSFDKGKIPHVYAVFPNAKKSIPVSIENICCQSYLYEQIAIEPESGDHIFAAPNEIENFFGETENTYATIISKLKSDLDEKNDFELSAEETKALKGFLSILLFRHPIFVHIAKAVVDQEYAQDPECIKKLSTEFPDVSPNVSISLLAHNFLKRHIFMLVVAMAETLENFQLCILKTNSSSFITSSMPVKNIYGEKDGIEYDLMGMAITPDLFLAFVDTEIGIPKVVTIDEYSVKRINSRHLNGEKTILVSNQKDILSYVDHSYELEKGDDSWLDSILPIDKDDILKQYNEIMNSKEIKYWR